MNYIRLINTFWEVKREREDFTAQVHSLYFAILFYANRNEWNSFSAYREDLTTMAEISNNSYYTAREILKAAGLISFIEGKNKRTKCAYTVIPLYQIKDTEKTQEGHKKDTKKDSKGTSRKPILDKPKTIKPKTKPAEPNDSESLDKDKPLTFRDMFELCRGIYPGTKRGLATEFEDFEKKNKGEFTIDFFRLIYQGIQTKKKTNEALAAANSFIPEWPHFKTYLNQRRWEEETPEPIKQAPFKEPTAFKTLQEYHDYWGNGIAKQPITNPLPA